MSTTEEAIHVKDDIIQRGRQIYDEELKQPLEAEHKGRFVAIEPNTGRYFLGDTGTDALVAAHEALPESRFYLKRIGYTYTHKLGGYGIHRGWS